MVNRGYESGLPGPWPFWVWSMPQSLQPTISELVGDHVLPHAHWAKDPSRHNVPHR